MLYFSRVSTHQSIFLGFVAFLQREFPIQVLLVFSSEERSTSLTAVSYSIMPLYEEVCPK